MTSAQGGTGNTTAESSDRTAKQTAPSRPVEIGTRVGIVAYGVTHLVIAWLVLQVAFGDSSEQPDQSEAFRSLAQQPFGRALLWVLFAGCVAVMLWGLEMAVWGYAYETDRSKNRHKRLQSVNRALVFAALAMVAAGTAASGWQHETAAGITAWPGGQFIVGAAGIGIGMVGVEKVFHGWQKKFEEDMDLPSDLRARQIALWTGQVGNIANGFSIGLIGVLVVVAAIRFPAEDDTSPEATLKSLAAQPFGPHLLTVVALGFAAFGVSCFFDARYRRV